jgi:hypothetical protein
MFSLARLASLSMLVALTGSMAVTQGCASSSEGEEAEEGAGDAVSGVPGKAVIDVPFYFGVPEDALSEMTSGERNHPFSTGWSQASDEATGTRAFLPSVGLRTITVNDSAASDAAKAATRQKVGEALGKAGVIQTGDIILSFRPELARTIPYAHIQMGTTHAGIARVDGTTARSVDQPLDNEHNSKGKSFQAKHYMGLNAFHIIRPRNLTDTQRRNIDGWLQLAERLIQQPGRPGFNPSYLTPALAALAKTPSSPATSEVGGLSTAIGKGLITGSFRGLPDMDPKEGGAQQLFCSEFAYHILALANCTPAQVEAAEGVAECATVPFEPENIVGRNGPGGLGEGPLLNIQAGGMSPDAAKIVFSSPNAGSAALSQGHRDANRMLTAPALPTGRMDENGKEIFFPVGEGGIVKLLEGFYPTAIGGARSMAPKLGEVNAFLPANYSPTVFLIETQKPRATRKFDYVATVVFAKDAATLEIAKGLSKNPIPHTANP